MDSRLQMVGQRALGYSLGFLYGDWWTAGILAADDWYYPDHEPGQGKLFVVCGSGNRGRDVIRLGSSACLVDVKSKQAQISIEIDLKNIFTLLFLTIRNVCIIKR